MEEEQKDNNKGKFVPAVDAEGLKEAVDAKETGVEKTEVQRIVEDMKKAADMLADSDKLADTGSKYHKEYKEAADYILRNMAVIVDRLSPAQFAGLPKEVQDQVLAIAAYIDVLDPDSFEANAKAKANWYEGDYNVNVVEPIHNLQLLFSRLDSHEVIDFVGNHKEINELVKSSGEAFGAVLEQVQDLPVIQRDMLRYFKSNAKIAITIVEKLQRWEKGDFS